MKRTRGNVRRATSDARYVCIEPPVPVGRDTTAVTISNSPLSNSPPVRCDLIVIDWLNDNSPAIQAASVVVLAIVTGAYVLFTREIARAAQKQAAHAVEGMHASLMPIIVQWVASLDVRPNQLGALVFYKNIGSGPALGLTWMIEADADVEWLDAPERVALGVHGSTEATEGRIKFLVSRPVPSTVMMICNYRDVFGNPLRASQELVYQNTAGAEDWQHGQAAVKRLRDPTDN